MFSVVTNIYNKETKGPTLMELFAARKTEKKIWQLEMFDVCTTCVQELEYRIDVCRITRGTHIEHL
jgi:hypothetical protein